MTAKKTIALGITGSIAAYKGADLTGKLVKKNYDVRVIMTAHAQEFVSPLTFFSLSRNEVISDLFTCPDWKPGHVALADCIDLFVVAPASANILAKMAHGIADDALSTALLSCSCPIVVAPAMNTVMWQHEATQANVALLRSRGVHFVGPATGDLACGVQGIGRMSEVDEILQKIQTLLNILQ